MGGVEEFRGVQLAADLVNLSGGVRGRPVRLASAPADSADAAPSAVARVAEAGATVVVGSYGSTISALAARAAAARDLVFWETGAVGEVGAEARPGRRFFRVASTGEALGAAAVSFIQRRLLPRLGGPARPRYGVAYVDDVYGRSVAAGALRAVRESGLPLAGAFPYDLQSVDYGALARRIEAARTDVLVVAAYLGDGIALRRAVVRARVPLVASIGTSSSHCMPAFGQVLGRDAVGLFASDKPDGEVLDPGRLAPEAGRALRWAREEYARRFGEELPAPALSGFAAAWALFRHVLPRAASLSPDDVARAALSVRLPRRSLPDGGGLALVPPGRPEAGSNAEASRVIWEWVRPGERAIVWPPSLATAPLLAVPIS
jgi:branched-chain amino acid transport system substrate-binding protein